MATEEFTSVWNRPRRGRRREQPALTQEQIVGEAIKLLDADGLDALTMRKLGTALGAVATAVYWHVANKEELIELVVDEVYGEIEVPEVSDPSQWREAADLSRAQPANDDRAPPLGRVDPGRCGDELPRPRT